MMNLSHPFSDPGLASPDAPNDVGPLSCRVCGWIDGEHDWEAHAAEARAEPVEPDPPEVGWVPEGEEWDDD